jgi:hypothetical protein
MLQRKKFSHENFHWLAAGCFAAVSLFCTGIIAFAKNSRRRNPLLAKNTLIFDLFLLLMFFAGRT